MAKTASKTTKTTKKRTVTRKPKKPVRCQVKKLTSEGRCVERQYFDEEEAAVEFAKGLKEGDGDFTYQVACYEKFGDLEPARSFEV